MRGHASRIWKPSALPLGFHLSLESGNWVEALKMYQSHPYHAPPVDTYELLKMIVHKTGVSSDRIKQRFEEKVRSNLAQGRQAEQVEWEVFWQALNQGDSRKMSMALSGAKITQVTAQTGVAEACAILLHSMGDSWYRKLIDDVPFGTVTKNNLVAVALDHNRWDIALEIFAHVKMNRGDFMNIYPLVAQHSWKVSLQFLSHCPKFLPVAITDLLQQGCGLGLLSEMLERARLLSDPTVVAPLLEHACRTGDYAYVDRGIDHLLDIGVISSACHRVFKHLCKVAGVKVVVEKLGEKGIDVTKVTVEDLERLHLTK